MRVFIGLVEAAGRNQALKRGFEQLGHTTTFIDLSEAPFQYGGDNTSLLGRTIRRLGSLRRRRGGVVSKVLAAFEVPLRLILFLRVLWSNDLFIYSSATSFWRYWDYRLIRLLGKTLVCQFHGSDSRPPYLNGAHVTRPNFSIENCHRETEAQKRRLRSVERWATAIINSPPQGYFHERPYYIRLYAGLPSGPHEYEPSAPTAARPETASSRSVRILHAPSNLTYKGTEEIREIVRGLLARRLPIEFVEIRDRPNREVIEEIKRADIVIDQLYCDYSLNGLCTEALWCGKPVIVGGYSSDLWMNLIPAEFLPPVVYCHPAEFPERLEQLVVDAGLRKELGAAGYSYVRRLHHPRLVAGNYLKIAAGAAPTHWVYDPKDMRDIWGGFFMQEDEARGVTRSMVQQYGRQSLKLVDKPELEGKIVDWAMRDEHHPSRSDG